MSSGTPGSEVPPEAAVTGACVLALLAAMGPFRKRAEHILADSGIHAWQAEEWLPLRNFLTALGIIGRRLGPNTLQQIGMQIPNHVRLPARVDGFAGVMAALGEAYALNHRGVAGQPIRLELTSERSGVVVSESPYPCEFVRGVILGFFQVLLGTRVSISHDACECRNTGHTRCTYRVVMPLPPPEDVGG